MKEVYAQATITPFRAAQNMPLSYEVEVDGPNPHQCANIGVYNTPEGAIASFTPTPNFECELEALRTLRDGEVFTFSLKELSL
jgi:hypothetical protein